jgi:ABC-type antimicrobial peptide transport system permease subunit
LATEVMTIRQDLTGDLKRPVQIFGVAVAFLLLIACANVAGLMLARGAARARELGVRASLGGRRGRLLRQLLTESLVLALAGGALGAWLSTFGVKMFRFAFPDSVPFYISLAVDQRALPVHLPARPRRGSALRCLAGVARDRSRPELGSA